MGKVNIYTDSRYAFATAHIHGAIYKERGLVPMVAKTTKSKDKILKLLEAIWLSKEVAVLPCKNTRREMTLQHEGII